MLNSVASPVVEGTETGSTFDPAETSGGGQYQRQAGSYAKPTTTRRRKRKSNHCRYKDVGLHGFLSTRAEPCRTINLRIRLP
jgi:hypothetical protein